MLRSNQRKGGNRSSRLPPLVYQKAPEFSPKISMYGLTCRRNEKTGTFYPINREECACNHYRENARFREDLRENKRKTRVRYEPSFWSE